MLQHSDLSESNVLVHRKTGKVTGVLDWSEAKVLPLGMKLYTLGAAATHLNMAPEDLESSDHKSEEELFWNMLVEEHVGLERENTQTIKKAGVLGVLIDRGFIWESKDQGENRVEGANGKGNMSKMSRLERLLINEVANVSK